ncbi:peptidoglycan-binding protein [Streptomyces sp. NPDC001852]|uniref:peptidoglycan-binding protein n=1 Tax=Streptomyces sp. NPDC001852 TaxID=3364619 RepID=UPI00369D4BD5
MTAPVFEEIDPAADCDCPGCVEGRLTRRGPSSGRTGARSVACAIVAVAAASAVLGATAPAAALAPGHPAAGRAHAPGDGDGDDGGTDTPQGGRARLHGEAGKPADPGAVPIPATTRAQIIDRAKVWVAAKVPYSMEKYWSDGYRQDCSGYVSMAWNLGTNEWTGSLDQFGTKITKDELEPGDILLYHNPDNPEQGSHVVIFGGWTDDKHTTYTVYEQTPPHTRSQATPYPYWSNTDKYVPYRYKGVTVGKEGPQSASQGSLEPQDAPDVQGALAPRGVPASRVVPASHGVSGYPGRGYFRPGQENAYITQLGRRLMEKGFDTFYAATGPGPRWGEGHRRAVEAFQRAQGWRGGAADGHPGPETWRRLFADANLDDVTSA